MNSNAIYYLWLAVAFLSLVIYNFQLSNQAKEVQCYKIVQMDAQSYEEYITSMGNKTKNLTRAIALFKLFSSDVNNTETAILGFLSDILNNNYTTSHNPNTTYPVPEPAENQYKSLQTATGAVYVIEFILSVIISMIINYMSNLVPEDFEKISKVKIIFACFCKLIPLLIIFLHWIVFIIIIVDWGFLGTKACQKSLHTIDGEIYHPEQYYNNSFTLNIVNTVLWFFLHYTGPLIRDMIYQEPFMYSHKEKGANYCLKNLGP